MEKAKGTGWIQTAVIILFILGGLFVLNILGTNSPVEDRAGAMIVIGSDGGTAFMPAPGISDKKGTTTTLRGPSGQIGFLYAYQDGDKVELTYMADSPVINTDVSVFVYDEVEQNSHFVAAGESLLIERFVGNDNDAE